MLIQVVLQMTIHQLLTMMKSLLRKINLGIVVVLAQIVGVGQAVAEQIVLRDGSIIQGEVVSMHGGSYQIKTNSLGLISLNKSQVKSITQGGRLGNEASPHGQSSMQSIQAGMVNNEGIMASIRNLQSDPDMLAILQDPEVMEAVQNFDLQKLANHPKIKKLMENSEVKRIQGKVN